MGNMLSSDYIEIHNRPRTAVDFFLIGQRILYFFCKRQLSNFKNFIIKIK